MLRRKTGARAHREKEIIDSSKDRNLLEAIIRVCVDVCYWLNNSKGLFCTDPISLSFLSQYAYVYPISTLVFISLFRSELWSEWERKKTYHRTNPIDLDPQQLASEKIWRLIWTANACVCAQLTTGFYLFSKWILFFIRAISRHSLSSVFFERLVTPCVCVRMIKMILLPILSQMMETYLHKREREKKFFSLTRENASVFEESRNERKKILQTACSLPFFFFFFFNLSRDINHPTSVYPALLHFLIKRKKNVFVWL